MEAEILAEIARREALEHAIATVINCNFEIKEQCYVRKGKLQAIVANALGVNRSNILQQTVIEYLESKGVYSVAIHGRYNFRGIGMRRK